MITLEDIKRDMNACNETDVFYYDCDKEIGYHMHVHSNGRCIYMKHTGKQIVPISEEDFVKSINGQAVSSIGSENYYEFK